MRGPQILTLSGKNCAPACETDRSTAAVLANWLVAGHRLIPRYKLYKLQSLGPEEVVTCGDPRPLDLLGLLGLVSQRSHQLQPLHGVRCLRRRCRWGRLRWLRWHWLLASTAAEAPGERLTQTEASQDEKLSW